MPTAARGEKSVSIHTTNNTNNASSLNPMHNQIHPNTISTHPKRCECITHSGPLYWVLAIHPACRRSGDESKSIRSDQFPKKKPLGPLNRSRHTRRRRPRRRRRWAMLLPKSLGDLTDRIISTVRIAISVISPKFGTMLYERVAWGSCRLIFPL